MGLLDSCMPKRSKLGDFGLAFIYVERDSASLLRSCWKQNWEEARESLSQEPYQTRYKTKNSGRTALSLATMPASFCPSDLLEAILEQNPQAVVEHDNFGCTPIHFLATSSNHSLQTLQLFVDVAVRLQCSNSRCNVNDWSPLLLATDRGCSVETIEMFITAAEQGAPWLAPRTGGETCAQLKEMKRKRGLERKDCIARTPLHGCWDPGNGTCTKEICRINRIELKYITEIILSSSRPASTASGSEFVQMWSKCMFLIAPYLSEVRGLVRHLVCLNDPLPDLLDLACHLYPEQLLRPGPDGRLPLHLALLRQGAARRKMIRVLLERAPEAVRMVDPVTSLAPACLVASNTTKENADSLSVIYEAVRLDPATLSTMGMGLT